MDNPLLQIVSKIEFEGYHDLYKITFKRGNKILYKRLAMVFLVITFINLVANLLFFKTPGGFIRGFFLVLGLLILFGIMIHKSRNPENSFKKIEAKNVTNNFIFYEKEFAVISTVNEIDKESKFTYDVIDKAYETKNGFYMDIGVTADNEKESTFIISKKDMEEATDDEVRSFFQQTFGDKFSFIEI